MKETKVVHGILLERRTCKCGCRKSWFAKPDSSALYRSRACAVDHGAVVANLNTSGGVHAYHQRKMKRIPEGHVGAGEMARMLKITLASLSNYACKGIVPSIPIPGMQRGRCFHVGQVLEAFDAYKKKPRKRRGRAKVAA